VTEFKTIRQAKEHLAGKITDEALRQGVQLTEVERKMLYFTESGWTLPDIMTVSAEFDQGYDRDEYEEKIGRLVRRIEDGLESGDEQEKDDWYSAQVVLSEKDHYLLVLMDAGSRLRDAGHSRWGGFAPWLPVPAIRGRRPPGDIGRLILMAFAVPLVFFLLHLLLDWVFGPVWYDKIQHVFW